MRAAPEGYDSLKHSAAYLDLSGRGKIKASGDDRVRLLHAMTTNHVEQLAPGRGCYAYFLSAQGRILADVNILCRPDHLLLDTEPETREKVFKHLDSFIIADDVVLEDETAQFATIAVEGPDSAAALSKLGAPIPELDEDNQEWGARLVARLTYTGGPGYFVTVPIAERAAFITELESAGVGSASPEAFRTVRIENGRPRYGDDITERFLAQEVNQPRALHFQKGCYLGQEIVERVRSRGQVHRLLVPLRIDSTDPPEPGTKLQDAPAPGTPPVGQTASETSPSRAGELIASVSSAGEITSAAFSPDLGAVAALGYIRAEHARKGSRLSLAGKLVTVNGGAP